MRIPLTPIFAILRAMEEQTPRVTTPDPSHLPIARHPRYQWRVPIAISVGLFYGAIARWLWAYEPLQELLGTPVSGSFIFGAPVVVGALTAFVGMVLSPTRQITTWGIFLPALAILVGSTLSVLLAIEAAFCVVVALPLMIPSAVLGGLSVTLMMRLFGRKRTNCYTSILIFLPYAVAPLEQLLRLPDEQLTVTNTIAINASPDEIWAQIASVPEIRKEEIRRSWIYMLGFPRPRAATLDFEGVGGKRVATFEREVSFFEVIDEWSPPEVLSFSIEADPAFVPANAFDEHIIIGGRFYDVLDGTYRIEALADGGSRLHLTSNHRLASNFNSYASWWSEVIMSEIQTTILEVIAQRTESK